MMKLESDRLYLRSFTRADAEAALAWLGDPAVMTYIEPPFDLEKTKDFLTECAHLVFCLCLKESGRPIGHVIWHPYMGQKKVYELGWVLARKYWGRGYAKEVSLALVEQARGAGIERIVLEAVPENHASIGLIEALGAAYAGTEGGLAVYEIKL